MTESSNLLGGEKSPYLLQHKNNPVWWHPWGEEAFARARREDKPVFLSIGYSTCYWCHVMEHDSFENPEVAEILNRDFVSIKVDREEMPDVDQIYMDVVMGIHGHGGWPMSVFLTPDREPFWGGTFFYRDAFVGILNGMIEAWKNDRPKIVASSSELTRYLNARRPQPAHEKIDVNILGLAMEQLFKRYDKVHGGFGDAPKFPPSQSLGFLLRAHACRPNAAALEVVTKTLSAMARGGLFDQVGGGFHRYSVDAKWEIPHFEKMLYDNAILAPVYFEAFKVTKNPMYRVVGERTLDYILRNLESPKGGYFCAEDAGEVDREGEFYSWTREEIIGLLPEPEGAELCALYSVTEEGNFEHGRSALFVASDEAWEKTESPWIRAGRDRLLVARTARKKPHRDEKILTSWNGLAITAMCRGYQVTGREHYLVSALKAARFIEEYLVVDGRLKRRYCGGDAGIDALLEDYVYLIAGYIALFESTGDSAWIERASALQREQEKYLWSGERRAYVSSAAEGLIVQVCEWVDGATPAPNGVAFLNLMTLSELTADPAFELRAQALEQGIPTEAYGIPMLYMTALQGAILRNVGARSCCVVGGAADKGVPPAVRELWGRFLPFTTLVWGGLTGERLKMLESRGGVGDKALMYVCRQSSCQQPTVDVEEAARLCSEVSLSIGG